MATGEKVIFFFDKHGRKMNDSVQEISFFLVFLILFTGFIHIDGMRNDMECAESLLVGQNVTFEEVCHTFFSSFIYF